MSDARISWGARTARHALPLAIETSEEILLKLEAEGFDREHFAVFVNRLTKNASIVEKAYASEPNTLVRLLDQVMNDRWSLSEYESRPIASMREKATEIESSVSSEEQSTAVSLKESIDSLLFLKKAYSGNVDCVSELLGERGLAGTHVSHTKEELALKISEISLSHLKDVRNVAVMSSTPAIGRA